MNKETEKMTLEALQLMQFSFDQVVRTHGYEAALKQFLRAKRKARKCILEME